MDQAARPKRGSVGGVSDVAEAFESQRPRLFRLAYRLLGSASEAEDAYLRLHTADAEAIESLPAWLFVSIRLPGKVFGGIRDGGLLATKGAARTITFEQYLRQQLDAGQLPYRNARARGRRGCPADQPRPSHRAVVTDVRGGRGRNRRDALLAPFTTTCPGWTSCRRTRNTSCATTAR